MATDLADQLLRAAQSQPATSLHRRSRYFVDECSSARWFTGWAVPLPAPDTASPVDESRTWLGGKGRLRYGRVGLREGPRS
jgi:hypothetical protein